MKKKEEHNKEVKPLVCVIVPTYNRPDMLPEALNSILEQSFRDFEIIVVNDAGSNVESIITSLRPRGNISYVTHKENRGLPAARNTGIRASRGKYIAYLDDDDIYYVNHLETLLSFLEASEYKAAYTDAYRAAIIKEQGVCRVKNRDIPYSCDFNFNRLLVNNYIPVNCIMHEKTCFDDTGMFDESLESLEDWDLWIRMSRRYQFYHLKVLTTEFRVHSATGHVSSSLQNLFTCTKLIHSRYTCLVEDPDVIKQQKHIQDTLERELYIKDRISVSPVLKSDQDDLSEVKISIVIMDTSGNRDLMPLIKRIESQRKVERVQLILAASESAHMLTSYPDDYVETIVVPDRGTGYRMGAEASVGDFIIYIESDVLPDSNYWLYKIVGPFIQQPDLAALTCRRHVKENAPLFDLWRSYAEDGKAVADRDLVISARSDGDKRRFFEICSGQTLMPFNNKMSCFRVKDLEGIIKNVDGDISDLALGLELLWQGKDVCLLNSAGVAYQRASAPVQIFQQYYVMAKKSVSVLPFFFKMNGISNRDLYLSVAGLYRLIHISLGQGIKPDVGALDNMKTFITALQNNMHTSDSNTYRIFEGEDDYGLNRLLMELTGNKCFSPEEHVRVSNNCLLSHFMEQIEQITAYLYSSRTVSGTGENEFTATVYKIYAMTTGEALGAYYREARSIDGTNDELERLNDAIDTGLYVRETCSSFKDAG